MVNRFIGKELSNLVSPMIIILRRIVGKSNNFAAVATIIFGNSQDAINQKNWS